MIEVNLSLAVTLNVNELNPPVKGQRLAEWIRNNTNQLFPL